MEPNEAFKSTQALGNQFAEGVAKQGGRAREVYGRFALQWLARVKPQCGPLENPPKLTPGNELKEIKLLASTVLLGLITERKDPAQEPFIRWIIETARESGLFDGFDGKTTRAPFMYVAGCITSCFKNLDIPLREYDIRLIVQMAIPKLWEKAKAEDFAAGNPMVENIRLLNLAEVATDLEHICVFDPHIAMRELQMYVEDHMTKTKLKQKHVDMIQAEFKEMLEAAKQWNSPGSDTNSKPSTSTS